MAPRRPRGTGRQGRRARGFTLLEILLTTILSATLLGILWGLFSVYLQLFETGQAKAEQQQLVRALMQQLADDLHSAIEDSPPQASNGRPAGSSGVRRFGLLGTRDTLRFDVLQVIPLEETPHLETDVSQTVRGGATTPQVPELRTIYYTFADPDDWAANTLDTADEAADEAAEPGRDARPGLTRRELDYETPYAEAQESLSGGLSSATAGSGSVGVSYATTADSSLGESLDPELEDDSILWAPEVVQLEFRYFDGSGWSSEWDSLQRKSLPVAVEVAMRVRPYEESQANLPVDGTVPTGTVSLDAEDALDLGSVVGEEDLLGDDQESSLEAVVQTVPQDIAAPQSPIHRLVIDLPSSRLHPAVQRARPSTGFQPVTAAEPLSVSPLAPLSAPSLAPIRAPRPLVRPLVGSAPSATVRRSDQWMRAER